MLSLPKVTRESEYNGVISMCLVCGGVQLSGSLLPGRFVTALLALGLGYGSTCGLLSVVILSPRGACHYLCVNMALPTQPAK